MSSGLGGVGFADGFVNGFGMVDQALQRRRANEIENKKIEQDQANNLATLDFRNKELGLQGEKNTNDANYNRDHLALTKSNNEASQLYNTNKLQADKEQDLAQNKLTRQSNANAAAYHSQSLENQNQESIRNASLRASIEKRSVAVHDMEIEQKTFELDAAKKAKQKQEDLIELSNSIYTNADGSPAFHLKNGDDGIKQINQFKTSGIDLPEIAGNTAAYKQHVENLKTALMDPSHGNKQQAIAALNVTEKIDINQGLGKQADGTTVTSKEISDVIQHPPEAGYPDGYYSFAIKSIGTDAKGNPQVRDGDPMTQYRSSSPYDQNVQRVTPEQLTKRVATQENLINFVNSNPQLQQQIIKLHHEAMPKEKKEAKTVNLKQSIDSVDKNGNPISSESDIAVDTVNGKTWGIGADGKVHQDNVGVSDQVNNANIAKQPPPKQQTNSPVATSNQQSGLQGQVNAETVKNNELEKKYRGNYRPFNDILDNPDLTAQAKLSAIQRIENSHNK